MAMETIRANGYTFTIDTDKGTTTAAGELLDVKAGRNVHLQSKAGGELREPTASYLTLIERLARFDTQMKPIKLQQAVEAAKKVDKVVIFAGLPDSWETEGTDRTRMDIPKNQAALIQEIAKVQENVIVVLHNGSAVEMAWIDSAKA